MPDDQKGKAKVPPKPAKPPPDLLKPEWTEPLIHALEGYTKVLHSMGHLGAEVLPPPGAITGVKKTEVPAGEAVAVGRIPHVIIIAIVIVVIVVVPIADSVSTRDNRVITKFLDVCGPAEREALRGAVAAVRKNPELVSATLGLEPHALGRDFAARLAQLEKALA